MRPDFIFVIGKVLAALIDKGRRAFLRGDQATLAGCERAYQVKIRGDSGKPVLIRPYFEVAKTSEGCITPVMTAAAKIILLSAPDLKKENDPKNPLKTILDYMGRARPGRNIAELEDQQNRLYAAIGIERPNPVVRYEFAREHVRGDSLESEQATASAGGKKYSIHELLSFHASDELLALDPSTISFKDFRLRYIPQTGFFRLVPPPSEFTKSRKAWIDDFYGCGKTDSFLQQRRASAMARHLLPRR